MSETEKTHTIKIELTLDQVEIAYEYLARIVPRSPGMSKIKDTSGAIETQFRKQLARITEEQQPVRFGVGITVLHNKDNDQPVRIDRILGDPTSRNASVAYSWTDDNNELYSQVELLAAFYDDVGVHGQQLLFMESEAGSESETHRASEQRVVANWK